MRGDSKGRVKRPSVFSDPTPTPNSLFGEILDWMLAPLVLLWPFPIVLTHFVAEQIANHVYDHVLAEQVARIVSEIKVDQNGVSVTLPPPTPLPDQEDESDRQFYQVALAGGEPIAGTPEIPDLGAADERNPGTIHFRDATLLGESVRIAYQLIPSASDARPLLVQVAETRRQRKALSSRIISGVLLPQFAIIPVAVILVWLGLTRGLALLARLQARIRRRQPDDLSPLDLQNVPEELRPMVSAFNDMMARLRDNLEAQSRFISAAAHQLKTPLTGLKTQTELALRETDCVQLRDYLQCIANGVERAARLTSQLLQLARAEAYQEKAAATEIIDLEKLAHEVTAQCVPRALARQIDIGLESAGKEVKVAGVPLLLREMLDNLIDNAIKYTPVGGRVTVRVYVATSPILEVEDNGIGIAPQERPFIFDRFYRVLGTDVEGSGLGLAIVRQIADMHHIDIAVLDNPAGCGTRMHLTFRQAAGAEDSVTEI